MLLRVARETAPSSQSREVFRVVGVGSNVSCLEQEGEGEGEA